MSRQKIKGCARHLFRDYKMKKFFITALFALLIGGFAITANAQPGKVQVKKDKKVETVDKKTDSKDKKAEGKELEAVDKKAEGKKLEAVDKKAEGKDKKDIDKKAEGKDKKAIDKKAEGKVKKVDGKTKKVDGKTKKVDGKDKKIDGKDKKTETVDKKAEGKKLEAVEKKDEVVDKKDEVVDKEKEAIKEDKTEDKTVSINTNYGLALKEYETTVNACIAAHNEMMINKDEKAIKEFNKYLLQARGQRDELYAAYDQLNPTQQKKYNAITEEFAKVDTIK